MDEKKIVYVLISIIVAIAIISSSIVSIASMPIAILFGNKDNTTDIDSILSGIIIEKFDKYQEEREIIGRKKKELEIKINELEATKYEKRTYLFALRYKLKNKLYTDFDKDSASSISAKDREFIEKKFQEEIEKLEIALENCETEIEKLREEYYYELVHYENITIDKKFLLAINTLKLMREGQSKNPDGETYLAEDKIDKNYLMGVISDLVGETEWEDTKIETTKTHEVLFINKYSNWTQVENALGYNPRLGISVTATDSYFVRVEFDYVIKKIVKIKKANVYTKAYNTIFEKLEISKAEQNIMKDWISFDQEFQDTVVKDLNIEANKQYDKTIHKANLSSIIGACQDLLGKYYFPGGKIDMEKLRDEYFKDEKKKIYKKEYDDVEGISIYTERELAEYDKAVAIEEEEKDMTVVHQSGTFVTGRKQYINGIDAQGTLEHIFSKVSYKLPASIEDVFNNSVPVTQDQLKEGDFAFISDPRMQTSKTEEYCQPIGLRINNDEWNVYKEPYTYSNEVSMGVYSGKKENGVPIFYYIQFEPGTGEEYPTMDYPGKEINKVKTGIFVCDKDPGFLYYRRYFNYNPDELKVGGK